MTFDKFHKDNLKSLIYFADKIVDNRELAKDIVAESFIKLWKRWDGFKNKIAAKSFLYTVVRNDCINYLRSKKRRDKNDEKFSYWLGEDVEQESTYLMYEAEILAILTRHIEQLPEVEREIFVMYYLGELRTEQIAERLKLPIKTVRNKRAIAKNKVIGMVCNNKKPIVDLNPKISYSNE